MKKILAIHYSQTGQLTDIMNNFMSPFTDADIDFIKIEPETSFPFPWSTATFFDAMPETVMEHGMPLKSISFKHEQYDLIVLGYQPWFLSPSIPTIGLFHQEDFLKRIKNTPVVTVIGSRNMWLNAQESIKLQIQKAGGKLIGNIPLIDKTNNLVSAFTILHWMLKGKKTKKWGILPLPGIAEADIKGVSKMGALLKQHLSENHLDTFQEQVISSGVINISTNILFIEGRAKKLFIIWAKLILKKAANGGKRSFWVNFFKYYLVIALFVVSPIVLTIYTIFVRPFTVTQIKRKKAYYSNTELQTNGKV
ncbi:MAG: hypothetical protein IT221_04330 [Fluviicola sp.]|nr:hypothetical protein [Fluviicola sp.]